MEFQHLSLIGLFIITLFTTYYLLQRQITQRKRAEKILRQQTERERLVSQIAHHIRKSLNLDEVLVTTVAEVKQFLQEYKDNFLIQFP